MQAYTTGISKYYMTCWKSCTCSSGGSLRKESELGRSYGFVDIICSFRDTGRFRSDS